MSSLSIVPGKAVKNIIDNSRNTVIDLIRKTYLLHDSGQSVNPDSYFLRFPDKPNSRVIALPSYLGGDVDRIGMKWIASFPDNVASSRPRASAVLLINDYETGYPIACVEAAGISAARTAASAALAARELPQGANAVNVSFLGAGVIARTIADYLVETLPKLSEVVVYDRDPGSADLLVEHARQVHGLTARRAESLSETFDPQLVVFATTAAAPYVPAETAFRDDQLLLNISLRDLPPELLLRSNNVLDDVEHCLKADTSPHLAERLSGGREFINGTIGDVLRHEITLAPDRPTIFSPFGLGVLDLAVGNHVLEQARLDGSVIEIEDFVGETRRW
ncbi:2,3-diaminopropionate biosynthesis protein SbnB [Amycolatopsis sp. QT-25]|uniref:2,3-diaminopropionate biosynthesis protein SbnB n=1 Tax=Amycolatopsis sp. QT-25 TaxID=3034022 RepID=UPI0023ECF859|nr:2,3-diaminopropionate biosynthesis protein SbnB [Amycolatopsis sp. QT-25]WET81849.1 2,3-diaminopropionate biosynthesis protein SbnB [Amycolatopsis sp. QT-25]